MSPELESIRQQLHATLDADEVARLRGAQGKWSAAEVLEHLLLTYTASTKGLERALAAGKPLATAATAWQGMAKFLVVTLGHFPPGRQAPEMVKPRGVDAAQVWRELPPALEAMDRALAAAEERWGARRPVVNHPILGPFSVRDWRKFHLAHARHHFKQLEKMKSLRG